jgi:hypothetical protein
MNSVLRRILYPAVWLVAACAGNGEGLDENGRPPGEAPPPATGELEPTIESIQEHVFTPRCATCHAGASAPVGLRLEDAQTSYDNLVDVLSTESPPLDRVEPGDPDNSYLIHKLEGTQTVGNQMPNGQPPLDPETIAVIRQWISDGAPPPAAAEQQSLFLPAVELPESAP